MGSQIPYFFLVLAVLQACEDKTFWEKKRDPISLLLIFSCRIYSTVLDSISNFLHPKYYSDSLFNQLEHEVTIFSSNHFTCLYPGLNPYLSWVNSTVVIDIPTFFISTNDGGHSPLASGGTTKPLLITWEVMMTWQLDSTVFVQTLFLPCKAITLLVVWSCPNPVSSMLKTLSAVSLGSITWFGYFQKRNWILLVVAYDRTCSIICA